MGNQKGVILARKRYSAEQIIGHLRQAKILISEGKTILEAARNHPHLKRSPSRLPQPHSNSGCGHISGGRSAAP